MKVGDMIDWWMSNYKPLKVFYFVFNFDIYFYINLVLYTNNMNTIKNRIKHLSKLNTMYTYIYVYLCKAIVYYCALC